MKPSESVKLLPGELLPDELAKMPGEDGIILNDIMKLISDNIAAVLRIKRAENDLGVVVVRVIDDSLYICAIKTNQREYTIRKSCTAECVKLARFLGLKSLTMETVRPGLVKMCELDGWTVTKKSERWTAMKLCV